MFAFVVSFLGVVTSSVIGEHVFFTKSLLTKQTSIGIDLSVKYGVYNRGPNPITDVRFDDLLSYPKSDFDLVSNPFGQWKSIESYDNVSVVAIVRPRLAGYLNASSCVLSYFERETEKVFDTFFPMVLVFAIFCSQTILSSSPGFIYSMPLVEYKRQFGNHSFQLVIYALLAALSSAMPFYLWYEKTAKYCLTLKNM
ncbi:hypothetical protein ACOME3_006013 [Neoechinorhynchus agilis]